MKRRIAGIGYPVKGLGEPLFHIIFLPPDRFPR